MQYLFYNKTIQLKKKEAAIFPFKKPVFKKTIIALGSLEHGLGLTNISLALSNFLCNKAGKKTAYVELNASNEISSLRENNKQDSFSYMGIHIFPHETYTSLPRILSKDYDYFILDMGVLNPYSVKEFAKYEKQYILCSLSEWKKRKTLEKLRKLLETSYISQKQIKLISNGCKKESTLKLSFQCSFPVLPIPFIQNPFQLNFEFFSHFGKILGQY